MDAAVDYPLKSGAVFDGDFVEAGGALVRAFRPASPEPLAVFHTANKTLVVTADQGDGE
jgi:hypothetical protein